jgi:outer membrane receptor for ferrienterochelin and colicins
MKNRFFPLLLGVCVFAAGQVHAQDISIQDLYNLDIEGLANIEVSAASKRTESLGAAPSIMNVVTRDDIKRYGAVNLHDILNRVPSLQVLNSTGSPNNTLTLRAATNQHYPNRILFLIDGRPVRDSYGGHLNYSLFTNYPISNIEQIEVIRGPGSVLYGTNAYAGVINIVSKPACDACAEMSTTYGSFGRLDQEARASYSGIDWSLAGAIKNTKADGERFTVTDETSTRGEYRTREDGLGYFVKGHYKNFNATAFIGRARQSSLGIFARLPESVSDGRRSTVDVGYTEQLFDHTKVEAHLTYNRLRGGENTDAPEENRDDLLVAELGLQTQLRDNLILSWGGFAEHQDGVVADAPYQQHLHNLYTQLEWMPTAQLKFVGGVQLNDSEAFKADLSPRLAMVYQPVDHVGVKAMFGKAFRSSTAIERELSIPGVITGNVNMKPETIETIEGQVFYGNNGFYTALSAYKSRMEDIIGRVSNPAGGALITNTGEQVFHGVEFETQLSFYDGWQVEGSMSWQQGESDTDIDDPTFSANLMAKLGVSYKTDTWSLGLYDSWFGKPADLRATNPSVLQVNKQPDAYHLVSANLNVNLNEALDLAGNLPEMHVTFYGENLLDEDIYFPEYNRKNINSFPIDTGRAAYGRFTVKF